jgi:amino acid adenylation domain-containing protein
VQVLFVLQNAPAAALELRGVTAAAERIDLATAKFDLTLNLHERTDGTLGGSLDYSTELFEHATVERLMAQYERVLAQLVTAPGQFLSDVEILTPAERTQLVHEWNATRHAELLGGTPCLHTLVAEQAARTPDAVAVICETERLTYQALDERANQLAHYLRARGVGPEVRVGLCLERSPELVVALLGILKAGGAYVPLDPKHPPTRLAHILDDAQVAVTFAHTRTSAAFAAAAAETRCGTAECCDLDAPEVAAALAAEPATGPPESGVGPANAAYAIYTSGSTGRPKGVLLEHRQIVNYVLGVSRRLRFTPGASYALVQPLTVDIGKTMLFPSLCLGGCLHVIAERRASDPVALDEYFAQHAIDGVKITPSHLGALQSFSSTREPTHLLPRRWLVLGGESSQRGWVDELRRRAPRGCTIFNHYGPTETTVGVLTYEVRAEDEGRSPTLPLGRPLPNSRAYVLDAGMRLVPAGVPGELYIGGAGLARGYLDKPALTAERFVPDPFGAEHGEPGARLYRTGDRVRWSAAGQLEFLGRIDFQVKLRGFRIELGEVENALLAHASVRDCVAVVREDRPGDTRLVAYVVPVDRHGDGRSADVSTLREHLRERLPDYMMPAALVSLDALPLSPNGKVDRSALPAPTGERPELAAGYEAPSTPVEEALAALWRELLGVDRVGVHDNFFDLGGNSILLLRAYGKLQHLHPSCVSVVDLFRHPTVHMLARHIASGDQPESLSPSYARASARRAVLQRRTHVS